MGHHLFDERYGHHAWKSFDIITEGTTSPMIKQKKGGAIKKKK